MGCNVLNFLYLLDISLVDICIIYTLKLGTRARLSMLAHSPWLQFVTGLPDSPKMEVKRVVLVSHGYCNCVRRSRCGKGTRRTCLDANEGIDLRVTRSPGCWLLQLCQTKQMWKGEPSKLLEATSYWIAVGAKLLHVVDETFVSIPTNGANCRYLDCLTFGASATRYKPTKKRGPAAVCRPPLR